MRIIRLYIEFELERKRYIIAINFSLKHTDVELFNVKTIEEPSKEFKLIKATTIKEWLRLKKVMFFRQTDIIRWSILVIMISILIIKIYLILYQLL